MSRSHTVFLRGISNVPMEPFRRGLEKLGLTDVASFGASGNLVFNVGRSSAADLERSIGEALGTQAFVLTRARLACVVEGDPFRGQPSASIMFLDRPADPERLRAFEAREFEDPRPVIAEQAIYFVYPARLCGRAGMIDFERELGVIATARASRVAVRVLTLMS